jgi:hypothetical protein
MFGAVPGKLQAKLSCLLSSITPLDPLNATGGLKLFPPRTPGGTMQVPNVGVPLSCLR